jgi:hypothetical protein
MNISISLRSKSWPGAIGLRISNTTIYRIIGRIEERARKSKSHRKFWRRSLSYVEDASAINDLTSELDHLASQFKVRLTFPHK